MTLKLEKKTYVKTESELTEDVRAFVFTNGRLKDGLLGVLPWSASFLKFKSDSCATALTVYIAIANYCTKSKNGDDRADIRSTRIVIVIFLLKLSIVLKLAAFPPRPERKL